MSNQGFFIVLLHAYEQGAKNGISGCLTVRKKKKRIETRTMSNQRLFIALSAPPRRHKPHARKSK